MPKHSYTPQNALKLLMTKLSDQDTTLAALVQAAIDAGKDFSETAPAANRKTKSRVYRRTVPFTHEEALQMALDALQAYFVEQPLFADSAAANLARTVIGVPHNNLSHVAFSAATSKGEPEPVSLESENEEKAFEIEMQTETQLSKTAEMAITLKRMPKELIDAQRRHLADLRQLMNFSED